MGKARLTGREGARQNCLNSQVSTQMFVERNETGQTRIPGVVKPKVREGKIRPFRVSVARM